MCAHGAVKPGVITGSGGACASICPASLWSIRTKRSTISNLCLLLYYINTWREKPISGFGADKLPTPQAQGVPRSKQAPFLLHLSFPREQLLVTWQGYFHVYHNLCNGSELTMCLLMLRLEAANETALLSQAPMKPSIGAKRVDETPSERGITREAGAHNNQDRNLSLAGQTKKSTTH